MPTMFLLSLFQVQGFGPDREGFLLSGTLPLLQLPGYVEVLVSALLVQALLHYVNT